MDILKTPDGNVGGFCVAKSGEMLKTQTYC